MSCPLIFKIISAVQLYVLGPLGTSHTYESFPNPILQYQRNILLPKNDYPNRVYSSSACIYSILELLSFLLPSLHNLIFIFWVGPLRASAHGPYEHSILLFQNTASLRKAPDRILYFYFSPQYPKTIFRNPYNMILAMPNGLR